MFLICRALDRERQASYNFLVTATDGGKYDAKSSSIPVEINIGDVNDNAPIFDDYPFRARVQAGTQPGQNVLRVKASDADLGANGEIVYALVAEHQETDDKQQQPSRFRVHPSTGVVTVTSSLSQDNGKTFLLEVVATDKGNPPLTSKGLIELRVGEATAQAATLKFQNDTYEIVVQENSLAGTEVLRVTAVRSDGRRQHVSYSIGSGNNFNTFAIGEDTGLIRVNDPSKLDAELWNDMKYNPLDGDEESRTNSWSRSLESQQQQSKEEPRESSKHTLTLVARSTGSEPLEAYARLVVRVSDVNDNPPIFTQSQYSATVLEGNAKGDFVVKVNITRVY